MLYDLQDKKTWIKRLLCVALCLAMLLPLCLPEGGAVFANAEEETQTEAPATEPPATEAPETEAPATEAPATEAPTEAPAETEALTEASAETEASTEAPAETETPTEAAAETEAPTEASAETEAPTEAAAETEAPTEASAETEAATETTAETEAPTEPELVDCELEAEDEKTKTQVTVSGVFPQGARAEIEFTEITDRMAQLLDLPQSTSVVAYNVAVYDAQGAKYQPASPVTVTFRLTPSLPVDGENLDSLKVIRMMMDESGDAESAEDVKKVETAIVENQAEAEFKTDSLSAYAITWSDAVKAAAETQAPETQPVPETEAADPTDETVATEPADETEATDPTGETETTDPTGETETTDPTGETETTDPTGETETTAPTGETTEEPEKVCTCVTGEDGTVTPAEGCPVHDAEPAEEPEKACTCVTNEDGTVTTTGCPVHDATETTEPVVSEMVLEGTAEDGTKVFVTGNLPEGTTVRVTPIEVPELMMQMLAEGPAAQDTSVIAYDVTLLDGNGAEFEPATPVTVKFQFGSDIPADDVNLESLSIIHMVEDENGEVCDAVDTEASAEVVDDQVQATLETESFSTFVITWTHNSAPRFHITLNYVDNQGVDITSITASTQTVHGDQALGDGSDVGDNYDAAYEDKIVYFEDYALDGMEYIGAYLDREGTQPVTHMLAIYVNKRRGDYKPDDKGKIDAGYYLYFYNGKDLVRKDAIGKDGNNAGAGWTDPAAAEQQRAIYNVYLKHAASEEVTAPPDLTPPQLAHSKTVVSEDDGTYTLTLDVTGETVSKPKQLDILLIVDQSESMMFESGSNAWAAPDDPKQRLNVAENALNTLINTLDGADSSDENLTVNYSIVGFCGGRRKNQPIKTSTGWMESAGARAAVENIINDMHSHQNADNTGDETYTGTDYQAGFNEAIRTLKEAPVPTAGTEVERIVIFLTDGAPTWPRVGDEYDSNKAQLGTEFYAIDMGVYAAKHLRCNRFYTIGFGSDFTNTSEQPYMNLTRISNAVGSTGAATGNIITATYDLEERMKEIAEDVSNFYCTGVTISDVLSENVQIASTDADLKISVKNGEGFVQIADAEGNPIHAENRPGSVTLPQTGVNKEATIAATLSSSADTVTGKTTRSITLNFPADYRLEDGWTYSVSVRLDATERAYQKYRDNGLTYRDQATNNDGSVITGNSGMYSNAGPAKLSYTFNGEGQSLNYGMPVIRLNPGKLVVRKSFIGLTEEQMDAVKQNYSIVITWNNGAASETHTLDDFTYDAGTKSYTFTVEGLSPDTRYIVTESGAEVENLNHIPTSIYTDATVGRGRTAKAELRSVYAHTVHNKTVTDDNNDGIYDLTLDIKGAVSGTNQKKKLDVLLIVDKSGSMAFPMGRGSRQDAAIQAVNVLTEALDGNKSLDVMYDLVTFSDSNTADQTQSWTNNKNSEINNAVSNMYPWGATNYKAAFEGGITALNTPGTRSDAEKIVIFLSDGVPTVPTSYYTPPYYPIEFAKEAIKNLTCDRFYAIGMGSDFSGAAAQGNLSDLCDAVGGNTTRPSTAVPFAATETQALVDYFSAIAGNYETSRFARVSIADTLSDNVQLADLSALPYILVKDKDGNTKAEGSGSVTIGGKTVNATVGKDASGKKTTVNLLFPDDFELEPDWTYSVTVQVKPTDKAYETYRNNGNQYPDLADKGTGKFAEQQGLYTNDEAYVKYTFENGEHKEPYPMPVIQLETGKLKIEKTITGLEGDDLTTLEQNLSFDILLNKGTAKEKTETYPLSKFTKAGGKYTLELSCAPGTTYSVSEKGTAVEGFALKASITDKGNGTIAKNQTALVEVVNAYGLPTGALTVRKVFSGLETQEITKALETLSFQIKDEAGAVVATKTGADLKKDTDGSYTVEVPGLDAGKQYTVTETGGSVPGCTFTTSMEGSPATIVSEGNVEVVVTNTYTGTKTLTITKNLKAFNREMGDDATFTFKVVGPSGVFYRTVNFKRDGFSILGEKQTVQITDLPTGTYTVTELPTAGYQCADMEKTVSLGMDNVNGTVEFVNTVKKDPYGDSSSVTNVMQYVDGKGWMAVPAGGND